MNIRAALTTIPRATFAVYLEARNWNTGLTPEDRSTDFTIVHPRTDIPHLYVSGPHSGDYYLLLDERSDYIFATRLGEHLREAGGVCDERAGHANASLLEMWIDETQKCVWYLFEACRSDDT